MAGFRIRRHLVANAILKAKKSEKGRSLITIEPLEGISVDGALLILKSVENVRDRHQSDSGYRPVGNDLRQLVESVVYRTGFDSGRRRAYVLVSMQYYRFLRDYTQTMQEFRNRPRAARPPIRREPPLLVLVG